MDVQTAAESVCTVVGVKGAETVHPAQDTDPLYTQQFLAGSYLT